MSVFVVRGFPLQGSNEGSRLALRGSTHSSHHARYQLPAASFSYEGCYLSEKPVELHALGRGVAALDQPRPPVHVHQALVVVVVDGGAEHPHVELLCAAVVHVLKQHHDKTRP